MKNKIPFYSKQKMAIDVINNQPKKRPDNEF